MSDKEKPFTFEISLSVLNHLGRLLYRSFATVLGEAISNAWDADAKNVWIYINRKKNRFLIKDDGIGMSGDDFQNKFLKIGYSKRKDGATSSQKGRPYIGRKGIGKLALLSCANKITVISRVKGGDYVGGIIDNPGLDKAITDDLTPKEYPLGEPNMVVFGKHIEGHNHGTIIYFENIKEGIRNSFDFLTKIVALYFRFSLLDKSFNIFLDGEKITHKHLKDLADKTQFLWKIGDLDDPYVCDLEKTFFRKPDEHETRLLHMSGIVGFVASVEKPRDKKIMTTEERIGIDLFVNGRLREKDILKHIPTARIAEGYLYGQIHFNGLDDVMDRFTSSRESIVADDPKYKKFLEDFRKKILDTVEDWDKWRIKHRQEGDIENERISRTDRASLGLYGAVSKEYDLPKKSKNKGKVDGWVNDLSADATFNFGSYAECFISENLVRKFIQERNIHLTPEAEAEAKQWRGREIENKKKGNISIEIRRGKTSLSYLDMKYLSNLVDKKDPAKEACLPRDAAEYKPIRDAVAHTSLLTDAAKHKLTTVRENIKGRIKTLLSKSK